MKHFVIYRFSDKCGIFVLVGNIRMITLVLVQTYFGDIFIPDENPTGAFVFIDCILIIQLQQKLPSDYSDVISVIS